MFHFSEHLCSFSMANVLSCLHSHLWLVTKLPLGKTYIAKGCPSTSALWLLGKILVKKADSQTYGCKALCREMNLRLGKILLKLGEIRAVFLLLRGLKKLREQLAKA